jgi:AraC family transcriptional regulator of adaptative response/methylated-DNA-[protein]-cysteine methyltransferase
VSCAETGIKTSRILKSTDDAENAGYRPCKRCRPKESNGVQEKVLQACRLIDAHLVERTDLERISKRVGMSPFHFQKVFQKVMGVSLRDYADICRFREFKKQLMKAQSVTEALYAAGYGSSSRMYERSRRRLGMTPMDYRKGGNGFCIQYTIVPCLLGKMLLAVMDKGICAISFGDDEKNLEMLLRNEFPKAGIQRNDKELERLTKPVVNQIAGKEPCPSLPLDIQATAFQWKVWEILRGISIGETRTYQDIAKQLNQPKANRAVAKACATNPVAVAIPCHRIVRKDGGLGGYRWGLVRKKALLEIEGKKRKLK